MWPGKESWIQRVSQSPKVATWSQGCICKKRWTLIVTLWLSSYSTQLKRDDWLHTKSFSLKKDHPLGHPFVTRLIRKHNAILLLVEVIRKSFQMLQVLLMNIFHRVCFFRFFPHFHNKFSWSTSHFPKLFQLNLKYLLVNLISLPCCKHCIMCNKEVRSIWCPDHLKKSVLDKNLTNNFHQQ